MARLLLQFPPGSEGFGPGQSYLLFLSGRRYLCPEGLRMRAALSEMTSVFHLVDGVATLWPAPGQVFRGTEGGSAMVLHPQDALCGAEPVMDMRTRACGTS